jgi:AbrB family looped-hinge helix DNA binding protein
LFTAISKVDKKGRISIPIGLRAKLGLVEGRFVKITFKNNSLILIPSEVISMTNGRSGVTASTRVCETRRPGATLGSGPKSDKDE